MTVGLIRGLLIVAFWIKGILGDSGFQDGAYQLRKKMNLDSKLLKFTYLLASALFLGGLGAGCGYLAGGFVGAVLIGLSGVGLGIILAIED